MSKPKIEVERGGESGNIFAILAKALGAMRKADKSKDEGLELTKKLFQAKNNEEAIHTVEEYVDIDWKD